MCVCVFEGGGVLKPRCGRWVGAHRAHITDSQRTEYRAQSALDRVTLWGTEQRAPNTQ